jgi:acetyl-CoA acetyltransferase
MSSPSEQAWTRHEVAMVGVGTTAQGIHPNRTAYQLGVDAVKLALEDAGLTDRSRITGLMTARFLDGSGIDPVDLSRLLGISPRVTGFLDYGTSGFTVQYGAMLIATGVCDIVVCAYGRNPPNPTKGWSGGYTYDADTGLYNAAAAAAFGWTQHMAKYGSTEETLGRVMMTSRQWAALNPLAIWKDPITLEQYFADPYVIWPLRSHDIVKVTAGAVAFVLTRRDMAKDFRKKPVYLHAVGRQQTPRVLEGDEHFMCRGMRGSAKQVYAAAGLQPKDVDVLMLSDASTVAIPLTLENYGFCADGESPSLIASGAIGPGGRIPVNTSGGQLSEGYLVGWLHHAELVRQLRGEAGPRQVPDAKVAQYCTTGRFREDSLTSIFVTE